MQTLFIGLILLVSHCNGLIVPQEVPSALSTFISSIPMVKKGTDSRVGFGFRLGNHADVQTLIEVGPQKYTKPLEGSNDEDLSGASKRMADQIDKIKHDKVNKINERVRTKANELKTVKVGNDSLKILFSTSDQYPIPESPIIQEFYLQQLMSRQIDPENERRLKIHAGLAARENAAKLMRDRQIKADLSDVSLDD